MLKLFTTMIWAMLMAGLLLATSINAMDDQDLSEIRQAIAEKGARWTAADNPIFRLSSQEQRLRCGAIFESVGEREEHIYRNSGPKPDLPERLDWRDIDGVDWVTPIRDQGPCGSCVAFGTMATFEGRINIFSDSPGQDLDLSEQHIFSCGGGSCDYGWWSGEAARYLQDYGAPLESCLPYEAIDDNCYESCSDWTEQARKISSLGWVPHGSLEYVVEQMKINLLEGPLVGGFTVFYDFFSYSSGVYQYTWGDVAGGHCISIIGWDDADSCWIVKNSWGPGWGEDGYFRIKMGHNEVGIEDGNLVMVPASVYTARVEMVAGNILDSASNGDGLADPGEAFDFTVTLENKRTWGSLTDVMGWLLPADPRANITDVQGVYPEGLPDGQTSTNLDDPFGIEMAEKIGICPITFNLYVTGTCQGTYPYTRDINFQLPITVHKSGWPVELSSGVHCSPLMVWAGGGPRRLVAMEDNGYLHIWDEVGQEVDGFPFHAPGGNAWGSVTVGDLNGDGSEELIFGSKNDTLYAINMDGSLVFKRGMGADILATPALADLNGDGSPEIVLGTMNSQLHVLTAQGEKYSPFPIILGGSIMADAALADLDGDGSVDVVVGASDGLLYALSAETGESLPGFPLATGGAIWSSPVIADLDQNGQKEIVVGSDDKKLYAVSATGELLFTFQAGQAIKCSPAIADLDDSNRLDIIFTCNDGKVYAVNHQGYSLRGWPYDTGNILLSSPIVLDIDGDGALEVVVEAPGPELIHLDTNGSLLMALPIESTGLAMSSPIAGDLDNDGDLEIAVGTPGGVYVWNYPTPGTVDMPWPMYRGNPQRTGYFGDVLTGRPEDDPGSPALPAEYALWQNYPNPFNPQTAIRYSLAEGGPVRLGIYNILGQEVISLVDDHQPAGLHEAIWDARDAGGNMVSSGLYLCRLQSGSFSETKKMVLLR